MLLSLRKMTNSESIDLKELQEMAAFEKRLAFGSLDREEEQMHWDNYNRLIQQIKELKEGKQK